VRIDAVELRRIALPLVAPFRTAFGTLTDRDILLVRVTADGVEGWGECVAFPDPGYSAEYVAGAQTVVREFLAPRVLAAPTVTAAGLGALLAPVVGHPMAKAALELAVLDAAPPSTAACPSGCSRSTSCVPRSTRTWTPATAGSS
jgi:O-succinylbenzoate synthase